MERHSIHCPNCSAPLIVPLGEVEVFCEYCSSQLRFIPNSAELEVVRTREEMKYRERVDLQKAALRQRMEAEEMDKWREVAGKVAISALPVVGDVAGRALFGAALQRGSGCIGCGCVTVFLILLGLGYGAYALFGR